MKKNTILLAMMVMATTTMFADDIWFVSPQNGDSVTNKTLTIRIQVPNGTPNVILEIEQDLPGNDRVVWRGTVGAEDNYTATVDVSKFEVGKYEVKAEYRIQRENYDGDVDIWIGADPGAKGQYFN